MYWRVLMIGRISLTILLFLLCVNLCGASAAPKVHRHGLTICSVIIKEMTDGRVGMKKARLISRAIARAGNKHFGRVTCGEMWLYMAIAYVESGFRNNVVNYKNCRGMFQIHAPSWARKFGFRYKDLLDPVKNADAGIGVFKYYLHRYKKLIPALSAYNSDHPRAARRYARAVLGTRRKIKKRYTQLYESLRDRGVMAYRVSFP
jgi:hypothetical protein